MAKTFPAFPISEADRIRQKYANVKIIHIVRHAEGTHNANKDYKDTKNIDAKLTPNGFDQCFALAAECSISSSSDEGSVLTNLVTNTKLVVTSTMTRCIQTSLNSFPTLAENPNIPFLAHESLRETVNYACDMRRPISQIETDFPRIDFSEVSEEDDEIWNYYIDKVGPTKTHWDTHRESAELWRVAERGRVFWNWLATRPEEQVVVCTHSAFLRCTMSWGQKCGVQFMMEQKLDTRSQDQKVVDIPLLDYCGDADFAEYIRKDYANCELRSFLVAFGPEK